MYPEKPRRDPSNRRLNEHGIYIRLSDTTRNRIHHLFHPKREPIPLGNSDGTWPDHHHKLINYSFKLPSKLLMCATLLTKQHYLDPEDMNNLSGSTKFFTHLSPICMEIYRKRLTLLELGLERSSGQDKNKGEVRGSTPTGAGANPSGKVP